jgi:hypothetical protein
MAVLDGDSRMWLGIHLAIQALQMVRGGDCIQHLVSISQRLQQQKWSIFSMK